MSDPVAQTAKVDTGGRGTCSRTKLRLPMPLCRPLEVHIHSLTHDDPEIFLVLAEREAPCRSPCQPTHREYPSNAQRPVRFRSLVMRFAALQRENYPTRERLLLLRSSEAFAEDEEFRHHADDGLSVPSATVIFHDCVLQRPVSECVDTRLIEADRLLTGRVVGDMGTITLAGPTHALVDAVIDDPGEVVSWKGRES